MRGTLHFRLANNSHQVLMISYRILVYYNLRPYSYYIVKPDASVLANIMHVFNMIFFKYQIYKIYNFFVSKFNHDLSHSYDRFPRSSSFYIFTYTTLLSSYT